MKSEVLKAAFSARRPERFFEVLERYSIFQKDSIWKKYGLWSLTEETLSGGISGEEQSGNQNRNGLSVIRGGGIKRLKSLKEQPENGHRDYELSEKEILQRVGQILDNIEVHHREWTGGRNRSIPLSKQELLQVVCQWI